MPTPLEVEIALWYCSTNAPFPRHGIAVTGAIETLCRHGMLEPVVMVMGSYSATEKLKAYVQALCAVPLELEEHSLTAEGDLCRISGHGTCPGEYVRDFALRHWPLPKAQSVSDQRPEYWRAGFTDSPEDLKTDFWRAGITVGNHTNRIGCWGVTCKDAEALRDYVLMRCKEEEPAQPQAQKLTDLAVTLNRLALSVQHANTRRDNSIFQALALPVAMNAIREAYVAGQAEARATAKFPDGPVFPPGGLATPKQFDPGDLVALRETQLCYILHVAGVEVHAWHKSELTSPDAYGLAETLRTALRVKVPNSVSHDWNDTVYRAPEGDALVQVRHEDFASFVYVAGTFMYAVRHKDHAYAADKEAQELHMRISQRTGAQHATAQLPGIEDLTKQAVQMLDPETGHYVHVTSVRILLERALNVRVPRTAQQIEALDCCPEDAKTYIYTFQEGLEQKLRTMLEHIDPVQLPWPVLDDFIADALAAGADAVLSAQSDGAELPSKAEIMAQAHGYDPRPAQAARDHTKCPLCSKRSSCQRPESCELVGAELPAQSDPELVARSWGLRPKVCKSAHYGVCLHPLCKCGDEELGVPGKDWHCQRHTGEACRYPDCLCKEADGIRKAREAAKAREVCPNCSVPAHCMRVGCIRAADGQAPAPEPRACGFTQPEFCRKKPLLECEYPNCACKADAKTEPPCKMLCLELPECRRAGKCLHPQNMDVTKPLVPRHANEAADALLHGPQLGDDAFYNPEGVPRPRWCANNANAHCTYPECSCVPGDTALRPGMKIVDPGGPLDGFVIAADTGMTLEDTVLRDDLCRLFRAIDESLPSGNTLLRMLIRALELVK